MRSPSASSTAGDVPVVAGDDAPDAPVDDVHPGGPQGVELGVVGVDAVVQHQREPGGQLAEQRRRGGAPSGG